MTAADWLRVANRHLTQPLCAPPSLSRLLVLGPRLPGDCPVVLELHVGTGGGAVDLAIRVEEPGQARALAGLPLPAHLRDFLRRWSERRGQLANIPCVWLEFDLDRPAEGLPTPSVCARLSRDTDLDWIVESLLPALHGERLGAAQRRLIKRCHREIPEKGSLLYVFSLLSRPGRSIRMEIFGLEPAGALAYLDRVAPQTVAPLAEIAPIFQGIDQPHLSFDIGTEILPRIGLEGSFASQREPRWTELFTRLTARDLCSPAERDALLAWPGYDTFWTTPAAWPLESAGVQGFCVRSLSHVKVVAQPDRPPEAKVYLLLSYVAKAGPADHSTADEEGAANSPASRSVLST
ncbi:MAG TPA: hypothetical protein VGS07_21370 [Thermoanaerobaculia bacterium]|nr:hypothetical protein [Thermoanaerobaculia bacterium]